MTAAGPRVRVETVASVMCEFARWRGDAWGATGLGEAVEGGGVLVNEAEGDGVTVLGGERGRTGSEAAGIVKNCSGG